MKKYWKANVKRRSKKVKGNTDEEGTRTANELRGNRIGGDVIFTVC